MSQPAGGGVGGDAMNSSSAVFQGATPWLEVPRKGSLAGPGRAWQGLAGLGKAGLGVARLGEARLLNS